MAINTATIQHRRGSLEDFNPDKMVPGELAFTTDGSRKVFAAFAPGDYKELISSEEIQEDLNEVKEEVQVKLDEALEEVDEKISNSSDKANVIEIEKSGETITATDSSDAKFRGMNVYGKSKQYSTTGKNLFDVSQIIANNNLSISGEKITITTSANSSTVSTGKTLKQLAPSLQVGTSYIITFETTGSNKYVYLDTAKTVWNIGQTITITQDMLNSTLQLYASGVSTTADITKMMIRLASITDATYEKYTGGKASPSPQYPQTVENCENTEVSLLDRNIFGGMALAKKIEANGGTLTETAATVTWACDAIKSNAIYDAFKENTRYTIVLYGKNTANNMIYANIHVEYTDGRVHQLSFPKTGENSYIVYTTEANKTVKGLSHYWHTNGTILLYERCGLFEGVVSLKEFEPYKAKQSLTIPYTLCGIPVSSGGNYTDDKGQEWVCDEVDMERCVYVQRIGRIILDDSQTWTATSIPNLFYTNAPEAKRYKYNAESGYPLICERYIDRMKLYSTLEDGEISTYNPNDTGNAGKNWVYIKDNNLATATEVKEFFANNPTKVHYILVTPIETPLTAEQIATYKALHSNYPTTTILTNNGAGMMVKYGADTKLYIDNKFAELAAQLV